MDTVSFTMKVERILEFLPAAGWRFYQRMAMHSKTFLERERSYRMRTGDCLPGSGRLI